MIIRSLTPDRAHAVSAFLFQTTAFKPSPLRSSDGTANFTAPLP
jgi:hypothetical protein